LSATLRASSSPVCRRSFAPCRAADPRLEMARLSCPEALGRACGARPMGGQERGRSKRISWSTISTHYVFIRTIPNGPEENHNHVLLTSRSSKAKLRNTHQFEKFVLTKLLACRFRLRPAGLRQKPCSAREEPLKSPAPDGSAYPIIIGCFVWRLLCGCQDI